MHRKGVPVMAKNSLNLILDIETTDAPMASVLLEQGLAKPHAGTKDADKKAAQVAAKQAKLQESAALIDGAPVVIVGILTEGLTVQFHASDQAVNVPGVTVIPCKSEEGLLWAVKLFLEGFGGTFVGHNIEKRYNGSGFDLPHLRFRYACNNIPLPACLPPLYTRKVDLMELYFHSSNTKKDVFVSLEEMALRIGVTMRIFPLSGKDVPGLWQASDVETCLLKNYYDLLLTQRVFLRLSYA
jgi:hypothetical protein